MNITKKIFIYSVGVTFSIVILILSYFLLMLSPLYANYLSSTRLEDIRKIQAAQIDNTFTENKKEYIESGLNFVTAIIPKSENQFTISMLQGNLTVEVKDEQLQQIMNKAKNMELDAENTGESFDKNFEELFKEVDTFLNRDTFDFNLEENNYFKIVDSSFGAMENAYTIQGTKVHSNGDLGYIFEAEISDSFSFYTSYIAFAEHNDTYYMTLGTAATPKLRELQPVIFQSLPSILLFCVLLIIISTYLFSRLFISPIKKLANTTQQMKNNIYVPKQIADVDAKDEIQQLEQLLDSMYYELQQTLDAVQQKNLELEQKNQSQQVFLMASSHQLKTPIASALLLIEGMLGKIGKYADTDTYLPKVRIELANMRQIIDEMLDLNLTEIKKETFSPIDIDVAINSILQKHEILIQENGLQIENHIKPHSIYTHEIFVYKILDNLIKNAIVYTPKNQKITLYQDEDNNIVIENFGITINDSLLPQIFEPFVRETSEVKGHGLGLYIVGHYAKLLDIQVILKNDTKHNSVLTIISFDKK